MDRIDKKMAKLGYIKIEENKYIVEYVKSEPQNFDHIVCIHPSKNNYIMQSYDKECIKVGDNYINETCGVEIPVLKLMHKKFKIMSHKYGWKNN